MNYEVNANGNRHYESTSAKSAAKVSVAWKKAGFAPKAYRIEVGGDGRIYCRDVQITTVAATSAALVRDGRTVKSPACGHDFKSPTAQADGRAGGNPGRKKGKMQLYDSDTADAVTAEDLDIAAAEYAALIRESMESDQQEGHVRTSHGRRVYAAE